MPNECYPKEALSVPQACKSFPRSVCVRASVVWLRACAWLVCSFIVCVFVCWVGGLICFALPCFSFGLVGLFGLFGCLRGFTFSCLRVCVVVSFVGVLIFVCSVGLLKLVGLFVCWFVGHVALSVCCLFIYLVVYLQVQ